ncbi:MAG: LysM peptidoglycan-binding domain-containing protein [Bacteriovoracia bacterium]
MKQIHLFILLALVSTSSCGHAPKKAPTKDKKLLSRTLSSESPEEEDAFHNDGPADNSHELVEVNADDNEIKEKVGAQDIDEEIPEAPKTDDEESTIPFLKKKNTRRMQFWVHYFTEKDRERFQRFIQNGEEYRHHIEEIFASYDLPKELYFVGLIESGYNLGAKSHASAVGPWQFIRATGKRYGLKVSSEIDERRDLFKATHAAARYLKDLYNVFSSWELALSAYNAGEYGILRRIMKHKTRDYYELSRKKFLPSETINYVPKVLAAMHILKNANSYGFRIPAKKKRFFDDTELRPVKRNLSLYQLSKNLNIPVKVLRKLNPALRRNKTPRYYSGVFHLRVPREIGSLLEAPIFRESRKDVIRRTAEHSYHRVRRGETLLRLARKYGTSAGQLARLNNLRSWKSKLRTGQRLLIEGEPVKVAKRKRSHKPIVYRVRRGDNLSSLARLFRIRASQIKRVNKLRSGRIYAGQRLVLPNTKKGVYTVRRGDHLSKIARKFNQPMAAIIKLNKLKRKTIYPGQKIIVDID